MYSKRSVACVYNCYGAQGTVARSTAAPGNVNKFSALIYRISFNGSSNNKSSGIFQSPSCWLTLLLQKSMDIFRKSRTGHPVLLLKVPLQIKS